MTPWIQQYKVPQLAHTQSDTDPIDIHSQFN